MPRKYPSKDQLKETALGRIETLFTEAKKTPSKANRYVELARKLVGPTEPKQAMPGTIRGDFASVESYALADKKQRVLRNLIHASDTVENAKREIALWFENKDLHNYTKELDRHF